jgi:hypothetical protein
MPMGALLPLRSSLRVYIVARGQLREAFLPLLDCALHGRCRVGAPLCSGPLTSPVMANPDFLHYHTPALNT